jgi:hypothetical protein
MWRIQDDAVIDEGVEWFGGGGFGGGVAGWVDGVGWGCDRARFCKNLG